jgi:hypothetical protein
MNGNNYRYGIFNSARFSVVQHWSMVTQRNVTSTLRWYPTVHFVWSWPLGGDTFRNVRHFHRHILAPLMSPRWLLCDHIKHCRGLPISVSGNDGQYRRCLRLSACFGDQNDHSIVSEIYPYWSQVLRLTRIPVITWIIAVGLVKDSYVAYSKGCPKITYGSIWPNSCVFSHGMANWNIDLLRIVYDWKQDDQLQMSSSPG